MTQEKNDTENQKKAHPDHINPPILFAACLSEQKPYYTHNNPNASKPNCTS